MNDRPLFTTRRQFLHRSLLGAAFAGTVPSFLADTWQALGDAAEGRPASAQRDLPLLVVVQMAGGNDGLNTLVPFANDHYRRARPQLALDPNTVLKLNDSLALAPALAPFKALYDDGLLGIVQGVGYPNPNRSHFRSTDIWQTASDSDQVERHGWLGRYFDHACAGAEPVVGVSLGRQMPLAFSGPKPLGVSLENPEGYRFAGLDEPGPGETGRSEEFFRMLHDDADAGAGDTIAAAPGSARPAGSALDFIERVALDAQLSSDRILAIMRRPARSASYPASALANGLSLVARLIQGGLPTRVFYVSQGGYDTHTNQLPTQERLLGELAAAIKAFVDDLRASGLLDRVLVLTFSEFGRRVAENASGGTDHGAAGLMFAAGGRVKAGLLGRPPSLDPADLLRGDLRHTVDFRSVYAGVLEGWLGAPSERILRRRFEPLALV